MILSCPYCAAKVRPADQDCPACKQRMTRRCPACAESIAANAPLCKYCGEETQGSAAPRREASPTPGIEFIEETPAKKKRCCARGTWLAALLLLGLACAFVVRTDCVACAARPEHQACISMKSSISHCERLVCRNGKTPLWVTVFEKMGGHVKSCPRKACPKAPSPETKAPARDGTWD